MNHYPLIVVVAHNRKEETRQTLQALRDTVRVGEAKIALIDNGSTDGAATIVKEYYLALMEDDHDVVVHLFDRNLGCPAALNVALEAYRWPSQPVVKIDNDVRMDRVGWVELMSNVIEELTQDQDRIFGAPPALISAIVGDVRPDRLAMPFPLRIADSDFWLCKTIIGHVVWHDGAFLDNVGFFDVLGPGHCYGFEDLIMGHKAHAMGWVMGMWAGWEVSDLQRHSAMGRDKQEKHVAQFRPAYQDRVAQIQAGGTIWTDPDGRPAEKS